MTTQPESTLPQWVIDAGRFPVAFAQVREDPLLDLEAIELLGDRPVRAAMIGSGGCTAAMLAASGRVSSIDLIDVNPAQLVLCRLKLHLLQTMTPSQRARILGHAVMAVESRAAMLTECFRHINVASDSLGPLEEVAALGLDHAGRYEMVFAQLRRELHEFAPQIEKLLLADDLVERSRRLNPGTPLGRAVDKAFDLTMALPILERLFSPEATRNSLEPFSRHFAGRTRIAVTTMPTRDNPYLWQLLVGHFPNATMNPWLTMPMPRKMPEIRERVMTMDAALEAAGPGEFDFVHLSNIFDWLRVDQAKRTLELAHDALRPGGIIFIRQLNSSLDIRALGKSFDWIERESEPMHRRDRSFFYRRLHLGIKR